MFDVHLSKQSYTAYLQPANAYKQVSAYANNLLIEIIWGRALTCDLDGQFNHWLRCDAFPLRQDPETGLDHKPPFFSFCHLATTLNHTYDKTG